MNVVTDRQIRDAVLAGYEGQRRAMVAGDAPVVTVRTRTVATIWGASGTWPLQLRISFAHEGTAWVATGTVASTWR